MSPVAGWILVPLILLALCGGLGLLAERVLRTRAPGPLLPALGLAVLIAVAGLPTLLDATAELAAPLVAVLAVASWALGDRSRRPSAPALAALGGGYVLLAFAPVLSGQASIAGYVALDDSAMWLAVTDRIFEHGRDVTGVPPGTYQRTLELWLGGGYPVGSFLPLGAASKLGFADPAAAYSAVIAVYAAIATLGCFAAARSVLRSPWLAAAAALVAVQASMFMGYLLWGGIKEAAVAALLPAVGLLALRSLPLTALAAGALFGVLGFPGLIWIGPPLLVAALCARGAGAPAAGAALLLGAIPALATLSFVKHATGSDGVLRAGEELGNLAAPLSVLQSLGLWPTGDFRVEPDPRGIAVALAVGGLLAAAGAVAWAAQRRRLELPVLLGVVLVGGIPAVLLGSPWVDAKVYAIVSPFLLLGAAVLAAMTLEQPRLRIAGGSLAAVLLAGSAWSTWVVARDIRVAPRERFAELHDVGERLAGRGPTVITDFDTFAGRYFLRDADPESATDLRVRPVAQVNGSYFTERNTAEVDQVATADLWVYRAIVRRRSPIASRPPAAFRRTFAGEYWEVWEREADAPPPAERMPLGAGLAPGSVPDCTAVRALARRHPGGELVAASDAAPVIVEFNATPLSADPLSGEATIPAEGDWRLYVGGTVRGELVARVGNDSAATVVGSVRHELSHSGHWLRFGTMGLQRGSHRFTLAVDRGAWRPGRGSDSLQGALGPIALARDTEPRLTRVPAGEYRELCSGTAYDWIETG